MRQTEESRFCSGIVPRINQLIFGSLLVLASMMLGMSCWAREPEEVRLQILAINDFHGNIATSTGTLRLRRVRLAE